MVVNSRWPDFHRLPIGKRLRETARRFGLSTTDVAALCGGAAVGSAAADRMIENAIGIFGMPIGLGLNLVVNGRDYVVPMAVEEPSVVAAFSLAGKIVRGAGGFTADADPPLMIGQVQIAGCRDPAGASRRVLAAKAEVVTRANALLRRMRRRGGGVHDIEVRVLPPPEGPSGEPLLVVHLLIDTRDAMGANVVNGVAEGIAPFLARLTRGKVYLRIVSNLADRRLARASCRIPLSALADGGTSGDDIAEGVIQAVRLASADSYRAATHNKGIMNGIDAVAVATGQDWRALEAGAHAFACRDGHYRPLSHWSVEDGTLRGSIELPLAVGTVGGATRVHPGARVALKLLRVTSARELAAVFASVGLAQNFAALRALGSVGIQKGHMALHARSTPRTAVTARRS